MSHKQPSFKEELLHRIWAQQLLTRSVLYTDDRKVVEVIHPGTLNTIDGPDFLGAKLRIGSLLFNGAVEIHKSSKDWYAHGHQHDPKYDQVILHVVFEASESIQVKTKKGFEPQTLNIYHHLPQEIASFTSEKNSEELPCAGLIPSLSPKVFERQIELAHREYLEQKVGVFFQYYDEHQVPSIAWKNALFLTLCDALGVPANREALQEVGHRIIELSTQFRSDELSNKESLIRELEASLTWNRKGVRSINRPVQRIRQAIRLYEFIESKPVSFFVETRFSIIWETVLNKIGLTKTPHNHRLFVSFFLPAMFGLGGLFHSEKIKRQALDAWNESEIAVPVSILKKFGIYDLSQNQTLMKRIGLVHQFNGYCRPKQCLKCEVLNKAISS